MNIKLQNVISDIDGKSGRAIIKAILEGERNPEVLYSYADKRIKASKEDVIKSLEANWRADQLFMLKMTSDQMHHLEQQMMRCDKEAENIISQFDLKKNETSKPNRKEKRQPSFNVREYVANIYGIDVTKIPGFKNASALTVLSETGPYLKDKFPTSKQFLSWLNVVPDNEITGGKVVKRRRKKKKNIAGQAFRTAANSLWNSKSSLGEILRSKKKHKGGTQAVIFVAKKLASIFYVMVTESKEYDETQIMVSKQKHYELKLKRLKNHMKNIESFLTDIQNVNECVR